MHGLQAKSVVCGAHHTVVMDLDGHVFTFGLNNSGQLGLGHWISVPGPSMIPNIKAICISSMSFHTAIVDCHGQLWVFGLNSSGQLGLGDLVSRNKPTRVTVPDIKFKQVSCGFEHTAAIDTNGNLYITGYFKGNDYHIFTQIPGIKAISVSSGSNNLMFIGYYQEC